MKKFIINDDVSPVTMLTGVVRRTMATGEAMMLCEVTLDAGAIVPMHQHIHEQVGYVVRGRVSFEIDGETLILGAGDSYAIGSNIPHEARAIEDSIVIDVFSPPREEYR